LSLEATYLDSSKGVIVFTIPIYYHEVVLLELYVEDLPRESCHFTFQRLESNVDVAMLCDASAGFSKN